MEGFLSIEDIPIGSVWVAADGGSYGKIVVDKMMKAKDVVVRDFVLKEGKKVFQGELRRIDWFKLQYRYYLVEEKSSYEEIMPKCPDTECPNCGTEMNTISDHEGGSNHYWVLWCDNCHKRYQYSTYVLYGTLVGLTEWPIKSL